MVLGLDAVRQSGGSTGSGRNEANARQPIQGWRSQALAQQIGVQAVSQPERGMADIARQPDLPHPVVLAMHEVISGSQPNLAGEVRHRRGSARRSP